MEIIDKEIIFDGEYIRVERKTTITKSNETIVWETVDRKNLHRFGASMIVALTDKQELILEKQWRAPTETFIIQFPGGLSDIKGESEEETAARELREETGYIAKNLIPIIYSPAFPSMTSIRDRYFFASEAEYVGKDNVDYAEEIEVITVPKDNLYKFLSGLPSDTEFDLRVPGIIWLLEKQNYL